MSAHVLLNLLNEFIKFNNTGAQMLDFVYHMTLNLLWKHIRATTCDFQQCGMCDKQRLRPDCAYAQSD